MVIMSFVLAVFTAMAIAYTSFATGVLCARNRHLRLVFVRITALLGLVALGGAGVSVLRAEPLDAQNTEDFVQRYTNLDELMSVRSTGVKESADEQLATERAAPAVDVANDVVVSELDFPTPEDYQTLQAAFASSTSTLHRPRPDWIGQPLFNKGAGEHWTSVSSGPWVTDVEAQTALNESIHEAVAEYVDDQVGKRGASRRIHLTSADIEQYRVVVERYAEADEFSVGTMHLNHAKLVFTPQFRAAITQRWQQHLVSARLVRTCVSVAVVMGLLFIALGVFKRMSSR